MTPREQIVLWFEGESVHNEEEDKHVPDFSCCYPSLKAPKKVRALYSLALKEENKEQIDFFERMFQQELEKEIAVFEGAKKNAGDYSDEMFTDVLEKLHKTK